MKRLIAWSVAWGLTLATVPAAHGQDADGMDEIGPALDVAIVRALRDVEPVFPESVGTLWHVTDEGVVGALGDVLPWDRYEGVVVDEQGDPVAGAEVRVLPNGATQQALGVLPRAYREFVGLGSSGYPVDGALVERLPPATTDDAGHFTLDVPSLQMERDFGRLKLGSWERVALVRSDVGELRLDLVGGERDGDALRLVVRPGPTPTTAWDNGPVTLRGRVVDPRGEPVPDATVRVYPSWSGFGLGNGCVRRFLAIEPHTLPAVRWSWSGVWGGTDEGGRFVVRGLEGDDPLRFTAVAYAPGRAYGLVTGVAPGDDPAIVLPPASRLEVDVVSAVTGEPMVVDGLRADALTGIEGEAEPLVCLPRRDVADPRVAARRATEPTSRWVVHGAGRLATRLRLDLPGADPVVVRVAGLEPGLVGRVTVGLPASRR